MVSAVARDDPEAAEPWVERPPKPTTCGVRIVGGLRGRKAAQIQVMAMDHRHRDVCIALHGASKSGDRIVDGSLSMRSPTIR
jgi:hypothetical protein